MLFMKKFISILYIAHYVITHILCVTNKQLQYINHKENIYMA